MFKVSGSRTTVLMILKVPSWAQYPYMGKGLCGIGILWLSLSYFDKIPYICSSFPPIQSAVIKREVGNSGPYGSLFLHTAHPPGSKPNYSQPHRFGAAAIRWDSLTCCVKINQGHQGRHMFLKWDSDCGCRCRLVQYSGWAQKGSTLKLRHEITHTLLWTNYL